MTITCACLMARQEHPEDMFVRLICISCLLLSLAFGDNAALESWLKRQAGIRTLEAAFVQERKLPSLKQPVTTPGKLAFSKPGKVRWQLGEPAATLAISDGTTLTLVDFTAKTARRIPADSPQAARFSMLTGKGFEASADFHAMFEITAHRVESGIHQYTLKPKDRKLRSQVPWIFLDIDPAKDELRAMELELQDKSRIRTLFKNPSFNGKLSASEFEVDLTGFDVK